MIELATCTTGVPGLRPVPRRSEVVEAADELLPFPGEAEDPCERTRCREVLVALEEALCLPQRS